MTHADELLREFILRKYQEEEYGHLAQCPSLEVTELDASEGSSGYPTDCPTYRLEAELECLHGEQDTYDYGSFGELRDLIDDLEEFERKQR